MSAACNVIDYIKKPRTAIPLTCPIASLNAAICNGILLKSACSTKSTSRSTPILNDWLLLQKKATEPLPKADAKPKGKAKAKSKAKAQVKTGPKKDEKTEYSKAKQEFLERDEKLAKT